MCFIEYNIYMIFNLAYGVIYRVDTVAALAESA